MGTDETRRSGGAGGRSAGEVVGHRRPWVLLVELVVASVLLLLALSALALTAGMPWFIPTGFVLGTIVLLVQLVGVVQRPVVAADELRLEVGPWVRAWEPARVRSVSREGRATVTVRVRGRLLPVRVTTTRYRNAEEVTAALEAWAARHGLA